MLFPVRQLLEGRDPPVCIPHTARVREAMGLMMKHGFSQLPVVDDSGHLLGLISHKTINRTYYLLEGMVPLLDLTVDHCLTRVDPLSPDEDVFAACDKLGKDNDVLVLTEDHKPIGILTARDLTNFFRFRTEDFLRIEDIEVTLRLRTQDAFPDEAAMNAAILTALGPAPGNPAKPPKEFHELSLGELLMVMSHEQNWPQFAGMFGPPELFKLLMNRVRQVRNQLAHYRGRADTAEDTVLKFAADWLALRTPPAALTAGGVRRVMVEPGDVPSRPPGNDRYAVLHEWLKAQMPTPFRVSFHDLETLLGGPLPTAARQHATWWSNTNHNEAQCRAWLDAGWQVAHMDSARSEITFQPQPVAPPPAAPAPVPPPAPAPVAG